MKHTTLLLRTLAILAPAAPALAQATFVETGPLPGKDSRLWAADSQGAGFSAGEMWTPRFSGGIRHAIRWTGTGAPQDLGDLPGGADDSGATGITDDGSIVVGSSDSANGLEAFRWESATGMVGLGDLPGGAFESYATGITADGAWTVGKATDDAGSQAVRWDGAGTIEALGSFPYGSGQSLATAVTPDGGVIVGLSDQGADWFPFRWTAAGGVQGIGSLPSMLAGRADWFPIPCTPPAPRESPTTARRSWARRSWTRGSAAAPSTSTRTATPWAAGCRTSASSPGRGT